MNPHLRYAEQRSRGYAVLEARPDGLDVAFRGVDATSRTPGPRRTIGRFHVPRGTPRVQLV